MGRGTDVRGHICGRIWKTVNHVFTSAEFPQWRTVVGKPRILGYGQGQQRNSRIINLAFDPYCTIL